MDGCNHSGKKSPYMIELMAQVTPLREASTVKKMNDWLLLLSLNKITHTLKVDDYKWCFEKKLLSLQKLDDSNRSS